MTGAAQNERGKICVTLIAKTPGEAHELARRAKAGGAGLVEYRLDAMAASAIDLALLLEHSPLPAIVAFRLPEDGGLRAEDEETRLALLRDALAAGAAYVDIELGRAEALAGTFAEAAGNNSRLVVSHHDFEKTPADLGEIARRIEAGPAAVVKLATTARSAADAFRHYEVLRRATKPTVAFAMGEFGSASRVMALALGSPWTYAALDASSVAAPGQIALARMTDEFRAHLIGPETAVYGVIGSPVGHSMSPAMLGRAFDQKGIDAIYLPFEVDADPGGFVRRMTEFGARGFSVTIPHKLEVTAALDEVEPAARRLGAVNTVVARSGRLAGTNTDLHGAVDALEEAAGRSERNASPLAGRTALVLGAGGAARAIVFGLVDAGVDVSITDVVAGKAEELARASGARACASAEADPGGFDIVANATPVGMHPKVDASPVDTSRLREGQIVFDAVYNPLETRLLREARLRGCTTVRGVEMFVRQGARQFELWTGRPAPLDAMRSVVLERLTNVVEQGWTGYAG